MTQEFMEEKIEYTCMRPHTVDPELSIVLRSIVLEQKMAVVFPLGVVRSRLGLHKYPAPWSVYQSGCLPNLGSFATAGIRLHF